MDFSVHAIMRIKQGDRGVKRTVLSPDEIAAILASGITVSRPSWGNRTSHIFYSAKDGKCLEIITGGDGRVVTISPASGKRFTDRLLAERKVKGNSVLSSDMPPMPTSRQKYDAALIGITYCSRESRRGESQEEVFLTWFDFKRSLFANRFFLETLYTSHQVIAQTS